MKYEFADNKLESIFAITDNFQHDENFVTRKSGVIKFLWNRNDSPVDFQIDHLNLQLNPNQITTTTFFHNLGFSKKSLPLNSILFNREFYCISDHDSEIGCNGILFFGTQDLPIVTLEGEYLRKFDLLWDVMRDEFRNKDNIQGEMLQMLLKRFIILCTRLAKEQLIVKELNDSQIDVIRRFNVLVDMHFKTKRQVKDYAELLFKSPKTLSNLFAVYNQKSPQQIIKERVVLEAKRMLHFTDKQTREIAYDLGFDDPAHFSRYFKKIAGVSPSEYKEEQRFLS